MTTEKTDDGVELDDEAKQLKLRQLKAEAQQAIAEAGQARLTAKLPQPKTKPVEGKFDAGGQSGLVADLVAHAALGAAAEDMAKRLPADARVLMVAGRDLIASDWPHTVVLAELERLEKALGEAEKLFPVENAVPQDGLAGITVAAALAIPAAVLGTAADLVGMFRSDYTMVGRQTTADLGTVTAAVAEALAAKKITVAVDAFELADSGVLKRLIDARALRDQLETLKVTKVELEIAPAEREIAAIVAKIAGLEATVLKLRQDGKPDDGLEKQLAEARQERRAADAKIAPLRVAVQAAVSVLESFDTFFAAATTAPANGYPPIVVAAMREKLHATEGITHILNVTAGPMGGDMVTKRGIWKTSVAFLAGATVSYLLLNTADKKVSAGTLTYTASVTYNPAGNEIGEVAVSLLRVSPTQGR